jgi:hypothetical protein
MLALKRRARNQPYFTGAAMQPTNSIAPVNVRDANGAQSAPSNLATWITQGLRSADGFPYALSSGRGLRRIAAFSSVALALACGAAGVGAQDAAQDAIDRGLLLRQQQEQDLQNRLNDAARNVMPGVLDQPSGSTSGSLAQPQLPPARLPPAQLPPADLQSHLLYDSQQQRLLDQQRQNQFLPAPMQEQQNQIQMLQFQREDQAQQLERDIQRGSSSALRGLH